MGDEGAEELPQPRRHRELPRRLRLRLDLTLGALLLALAALVGTALGHHGGSATSTTPAAPPASSAIPAPPSGSPLPSGTSFVTVAPAREGGSLSRPGFYPQLCRAQTECVSVTAVAQSARTAVRDAFPGARITMAREVRLHVKNYGDALTAMDVRARRGDARIFVSLRGAARTDVGRDAGSRAGTLISGHHRITQYETTLAQYDVLVQVVVRANQHQDIAPLARLANDVRLVARY